MALFMMILRLGAVVSAPVFLRFQCKLLTTKREIITINPDGIMVL